MTSSSTRLPDPALASPARERLHSLDAFRGLVIVVMFLVNVGGWDDAFKLGAWAPEHARVWMPHMGWNSGRMGNGLADYVFPWFLFIVGAAIPFSMTSGRGRGHSPAMKILAAARRGLIIYLLGSLMWAASIAYKPADPATKWHGPIDWTIVLHWDILPLIGFGYMLGVALYLAPRSVRIAFVVLVLAGKWYLIHGPVLSRSTPLPDGLTISGWRDVLKNNLGPNGAVRAWGWWGTLVGQGLAFGTLVVIGSMVGEVLRRASALGSAPDARARSVNALAGAGGAMCLLALLAWLAFDMPFSKDYVSPSYVLITAGTATLVLAGMFHWVDQRRLTSLSFLRIYGSNALAVYILAEFLWKTVLMQWHIVLPAAYQPPQSAVAITAANAWLKTWFGPTLGAYSVVTLYILAYWVFCWALWRKKWFIKV